MSVWEWIQLVAWLAVMMLYAPASKAEAEAEEAGNLTYNPRGIIMGVDQEVSTNPNEEERMVATMSRAAAIRKAKAEVVLVRTGPIAGGWAGARVNVLDHGYKAWVEGKQVDYATARQRYKEEVVSKALALLGWEPYDIERVLRDSWEWTGRRVEEIIRELMEDLNG